VSVSGQVTNVATGFEQKKKSPLTLLFSLYIIACRATVNLFLKQEIIHYPTPHQSELESSPAWTEGDLGTHWKEVFFRRIIQHNIRVASLYYKRIHGSRLAQLLQLDLPTLEQEIAGMVSDGSIYAKMDRPSDIVRFCPPSNPEAILSNWAGDIDELLHLVETTTHLIHKEYMTT
jgi:26S proteasome regulatory subunit N5